MENKITQKGKKQPKSRSWWDNIFILSQLFSALQRRSQKCFSHIKFVSYRSVFPSYSSRGGMEQTSTLYGLRSRADGSRIMPATQEDQEVAWHSERETKQGLCLQPQWHQNAPSKPPKEGSVSGGHLVVQCYFLK